LYRPANQRRIKIGQSEAFERIAGHNEAMLSVAGVTAIMMIASLILLILY
jgi:hypothetical protein